jgi:hypothetical protein
MEYEGRTLRFFIGSLQKYLTPKYVFKIVLSSLPPILKNLFTKILNRSFTNIIIGVGDVFFSNFLTIQIKIGPKEGEGSTLLLLIYKNR